MLTNLYTFFSLLSAKQRKKLVVIQVMTVAMTFTEVISMLLIWNLVGIVIEPSVIHTSLYLQKFYAWSGVSDDLQFIVFLSFLFAAFCSLSTFVSIFCLKKSFSFIHNLCADIRSQLHGYFLYRSWLYHTEHNAASLVKQVIVEVDRFLSGIIIPIIQTNARVTLTIGIFVFLIILNPVIVFFLTLFLSFFYFSFYRFVGLKLKKNGRVITKGNKERQQLLSESFGGIKDVLLLNCQSNFTGKFREINKVMAKSYAENSILPQIPRFFLELIIVNMVLWAILFTFGDVGGYESEDLTPLLSVYAIATLKLLPAFQQIYQNIATIRGNIDVFSVLKDDLENSAAFSPEEKNINKMEFKYNLTIKNLCFIYPGNKNKTLQNINLVIPAKKSVALVGLSGAGKSTLLDVLLGLILVEEGEVIIDGVVLNKYNVAQWQKNIGYVAQDVFLLDGSITENIALGVPTNEIDHEKVKDTIQYAQLDTLIHSLADGVNTFVGERGVKISGGQKQRIAIARALYHDAGVLMMDEATNALDGLTEKMIIKTLNSFSNVKTIIMIAHRLNTIKHCDKVYLMERGSIIDSGTYDELLKRNAFFKKMANVS